MIFDVHVFHGPASRRHVVLVTWPMRFHANLAVVWFVGFAGRFEISDADGRDRRAPARMGRRGRRKDQRSGRRQQGGRQSGHAKEGARHEEEHHRGK